MHTYTENTVFVKCYFEDSALCGAYTDEEGQTCFFIFVWNSGTPETLGVEPNLVIDSRA